MLVATLRLSSPAPDDRTTALSLQPVPWAVMNPNTSAARTSAGDIATTPKVVTPELVAS